MKNRMDKRKGEGNIGRVKSPMPHAAAGKHIYEAILVHTEPTHSLSGDTRHPAGLLCLTRAHTQYNPHPRTKTLSSELQFGCVEDGPPLLNPITIWLQAAAKAERFSSLTGRHLGLFNLRLEQMSMLKQAHDMLSQTTRSRSCRHVVTESRGLELISCSGPIVVEKEIKQQISDR